MYFPFVAGWCEDTFRSAGGQSSNALGALSTTETAINSSKALGALATGRRSCSPPAARAATAEVSFAALTRRSLRRPRAYGRERASPFQSARDVDWVGERNYLALALLGIPSCHS